MGNIKNIHLEWKYVGDLDILDIVFRIFPKYNSLKKTLNKQTNKKQTHTQKNSSSTKPGIYYMCLSICSQ